MACAAMNTVISGTVKCVVVPNLPSQFSFQEKYQPHMAGIAVCSPCFLQNWHQITMEQGSCCIVCTEYYFGF